MPSDALPPHAYRRSPKIFLLIRALSAGGAETQVVQLANALGERGIPVSIVTLYDNGPLEQAIDRSKVGRYSLGKRERWDVVRPIARLLRLLRRHRPALLYAFLPAQTTLAALLQPFLPPCRLVFGLRSSLDYRRTDWLQRAVYALETRLARGAALVIVNSLAGRDAALRRGLSADRLVVVDNLIDPVRYAPDPASRIRQRAAWRIPDAAPLIGMAARLDPMKGHPTFLDAAGCLLKTHPDVRFVLVGDGPAAYAETLRRAAATRGLDRALLWTGDCRDMRAAYNALDIACLSSDEGEGFPNAIAEAMACGVPVVATDVGDTARLIGDTGLVVPPRNPRRLAEAWAALLATDRVRLGQAARQRILSEFDTGRVVDHNVRVLNSLIHSRIV
jgi:glycosyltransferase involved in cell wall biosynthesis